MAERSRGIVIFIFLLFIFVLLGVIIFIFSYNTYKSTSNYTTQTSKISIDCTGYSFRVVGGSLSYDNGTLALELDTTLATSSEKNALVFVVGGKEIETQPIDFTFRKQRLRIELENPGKFDIYVKGCKDIIKKCDLALNRCE